MLPGPVRQPQPPAPQRRSRAVLALAGLGAAFALAAWFASRSRNASEPEAPADGVSSPAQPAALSSALPGGDRLFQPPPPDEDLAFRRLMTYLEAGAADPEAAPVAQKFVGEFRADPQLNGVYQDFQRRAAKGEQPKAIDFLQRLRELPAFRQLFARFATPAHSSAIHVLARNPEVVRLAEKHLAALTGAKPRSFRGVERAGPVGNYAAVRAGAPGRRFDPVGAMGPGALASVIPGDDGGGRRVSAAVPPPNALAGPSAHEVDTKLGGISKAGDTDKKVERFCELYPQFCEGYPPHVRDEFRSLYENQRLIETYGLWGACFKQGIYQLCQQACVGRCVAATAWSSCMDAYDQNGPACIRECGKLSYCTVDPATWQKFCVDPPIPAQECAIAATPTPTPSPEPPLKKSFPFCYSMAGVCKICQDSEGAPYTYTPECTPLSGNPSFLAVVEEAMTNQTHCVAIGVRHCCYDWKRDLISWGWSGPVEPAKPCPQKGP